MSDDATLMAQVREGDEVALGTLMGRWEIPLKVFIGRIVLNSTDARELALETFVRVWQKRTSFRSGADFRPWLFTIAVNLSRNRLRWWRRRPEVNLDAWREPLSDQPDGKEHMETLERIRQVQFAIAGLPPKLRETLVLSLYDNLSHVEIAAIVQATPNAVEKRLARAREKLRPEFADQNAEALLDPN